MSKTQEVADRPSPRGRSGSVQSIERVFGLLEAIADNGGTMSISQLAAGSGLPLPTIHRLVRTLVDVGYLRQDESRRYVLAPKLMRLGERAASMLGIWARPYLSRLVDELGESANLAMLDGDQVVYVAQQESQRSMRMFTEVGRRVEPHCTAVGKAMMARMPTAEVRGILERTGLPKHTENTVDDLDTFARQLEEAAERGYALDEGEQEVGVRCVAVAVPDAPARLALSVSGPVTRMTDAVVARAVPLLTEAADGLAAALD